MEPTNTRERECVRSVWPFACTSRAQDGLRRTVPMQAGVWITRSNQATNLEPSVPNGQFTSPGSGPNRPLRDESSTGFNWVESKNWLGDDYFLPVWSVDYLGSLSTCRLTRWRPRPS